MAIRRSTLAFGLVGLAGVVAATVFLLQSRQAPGANRKPDNDPQARALIETMDTVLQKRFGTADMYRGISRVVMAGSDKELHHPDPIYSTNPQEKKLLENIADMKRAHEVCFFHYKPIPRSLRPFPVGTSHGFPPEARHSSKPALVSLTAQMPTYDDYRKPVSPLKPLTPEEQARRRAVWKKWQEDLKAHEEALAKLAAKETTRLNRGEKVETVYNNWYVEMRPILASSDACLKCHTNAKKGETLAAMVYLVRQNETTRTAHNR